MKTNRKEKQAHIFEAQTKMYTIVLVDREKGCALCEALLDILEVSGKNIQIQRIRNTNIKVQHRNTEMLLTR